jgi:hypothetical protein
MESEKKYKVKKKREKRKLEKLIRLYAKIIPSGAAFKNVKKKCPDLGKALSWMTSLSD